MTEPLECLPLARASESKGSAEHVVPDRHRSKNPASLGRVADSGTRPTVAGNWSEVAILEKNPPASSLKGLAKMADIALAAGSTDNGPAHNEFVKGLAEYRQGHFAAAVEWLRKVAAQEGVPARTAQADATLAMAEYQMGQTNAARTALAQGIKIAETELAKPGRIDWNEGLIAQFLLREAQGLINGTPAPAADGK